VSKRWKGGWGRSWNVNSKHRSVNTEYEREDGNCEESKAETDDRNGEYVSW
jgi:hypothetical protein